MIIRRKHIQDVAHRLHAKHRVERPPVDVEKIATQLGATIHKNHVEDDVSGFLAWKKGKPIIGVNVRHSQNRQRFTIAHEIAHIVLHPQLSLHIDETFSIKLRSDKSGSGKDTDEKEANLFAAELLMPSKLIVEDIKRIGVLDLHDERRIEELAKSYQVSTQAMTIRLQQVANFRE
jgi:Zn-dependent peptidase ImmA (M78 family)